MTAGKGPAPDGRRKTAGMGLAGILGWGTWVAGMTVVRIGVPGVTTMGRPPAGGPANNGVTIGGIVTVNVTASCPGDRRTTFGSPVRITSAVGGVSSVSPRSNDRGSYPSTSRGTPTASNTRKKAAPARPLPPGLGGGATTVVLATL